MTCHTDDKSKDQKENKCCDTSKCDEEQKDKKKEGCCSSKGTEKTEKKCCS